MHVQAIRPRKRILLVGQAPSKSSDPTRPLTGGFSGSKIQALAGLTLRQYVRTFSRVNLIHAWPGKHGKGDAFDREQARASARRITVLGALEWGVVCVGREVAAAFNLPRALPYLTWSWVDGRQFAILPHPSGVNRWWNDPENTRRAARFLRSSIKRMEETA